jgi:hypothetical protein
MQPTILPVTCALAVIGLAACSKSDTSPAPEHSAVAAAMPDAATTPGAQGPGTAAPHGTPPNTQTLSDTHPTPAGPSQAPPPATNAAGQPLQAPSSK